MENTKGVELNAVYPMQVEDVDGEIYLFRYYADDKDEISVGNYFAIWIDQQTNNSKILFNTEGNHEFTSLYEFYDMQIRDVDGNEEIKIAVEEGATLEDFIAVNDEKMLEKLEVPEVYQEITDQGEDIEDVELEEIEVKEIDGVKNICMKVEIVLWGGSSVLFGI